MKFLLLSLSLLFSSLSVYAAKPAGNVVVAANTVTSSSGIYFESATRTLPSIIAGSTPTDFLVDLYDACSNKDALNIKLQTNPALSDGLGHSIPLTYTLVSIANGTTTALLSNIWVELINNGNPSYRDGMTSPGYVSISTGPISPTQVAGSYSSGPIAVELTLGIYSSTVIGYLTINTVVEEFIVIGFVDTSADTTGVRFVGNDISFGMITPGTTPSPITRDVYVHTNRESDIQITFANTPSLLSTVDGVSTIPITYSYSLNSVSANIVAGTPFIASNGSNDGSTSVGTITFSPAAVPSSQASDAYATTVNIIVSAM